MTRGKKIALKGLHVVHSNGRTYVYAWRGGPRIKAPIGTPEFHNEYNEAIESRKALPSNNTVAGLVLDFRNSRQFRELATATRKDYERYFPSILSEFGAAPVLAFDDPRIKKDIRKWHEGFDHDRQADKALGALSRLLSFAQADGMVSGNAALRIEKRYVRAANPAPWSEKQLAAFCEIAPPHIERIATLAALTGLARADLARLTWAHVKNNKITIRRQKSKQVARIFIGPELQTFLDRTPSRKKRLSILVSRRGAPFTADGLGKAFDAERREIGIRQTLHDLRATFATRLYRAGATHEDVADTLGWSLDTVRYIRRHYVDDEAIFSGRVRRLQTAQTST